MHFQVSLWKCQADLCPRKCRTKWLFSLQEKMCSRRSKHHLVSLLLMAALLKVSSKNLQIVRFTYFNIFRGGKFHDSYTCIKSNTSPLKWVQHANFLSFKKSYLIFWEYNVIAAFPTSLSSFQIFPYTLPFSFKFLASFENWCCLHICMHTYIFLGI